MKRILYFTAQVLLILSSLLVGFVSSTEMLILTLSCLLCGTLLMIAYCVGSKSGWSGLFLYLMAGCCHLFYLFVFSPYSASLMALMLSFMAASVVMLVVLYKKSYKPSDLLWDAIFIKTALLPEVLLNTLMSKQTGNELFSYFSWVLLAVTSAYVILADLKLYNDKIVSSSWALVCGMLQFMFGTDIIGAIILLVMDKSWKAPVEDVRPEPTILKKGAFSKTPRRKTIKK